MKMEISRRTPGRYVREFAGLVNISLSIILYSERTAREEFPFDQTENVPLSTEARRSARESLGSASGFLADGSRSTLFLFIVLSFDFFSNSN